MKSKQLPSQETLRNFFDYVDGQLIWKKTRSMAKAGFPAGWIEKNGYVSTNLNGTRYRVHRLIFMFFNGYCPEFIDHIDGNKINNRIENLRSATSYENSCNRKANKKNKLNVKGVCMERGKYKANIKKFGKTRHLGYFDSLEDAKNAYIVASKEIHGEYSWKNLT